MQQLSIIRTATDSQKTTKSLNEHSKFNKRNQTLDPIAGDRVTQASENIKNTSNNSLDIARPDLNQTPVEQQEKPENEKNIVVIMDSNRKFINFNQLDGRNLQKDKVIVMPCSNITSAEKILESHQIDNPSKISLHVGINDIDNTEAESIAKDWCKQLRNLKQNTNVRCTFQILHQGKMAYGMQ